MVATVYKITLPNGAQLILKICGRTGDYLREVYFLNHFAGKLPVPRIVQLVQPETGIHGAVLMECLKGELLRTADFTDKVAHEMGSLLARIHLNRTSGYGDLTQPQDLSPDPRVPFTLKFEEGLDECSNHLPPALLNECRDYFNAHIHLLNSLDGPCMIHRDFRPGNVIVSSDRIEGIIDWSSARSSFAEDDFCPLEHGEWPAHPASRSSFLAGYASIRPVPDYSALMPLLRLSRVIATIGFTVKRCTWESSNARIYQVNRQFLETFF
ncbi:MAG: phosphotransferase [Verrucomicrobia bacterium]|nr:phosphotransferase [Verrucomicrobiota bacterium]